MRDRNALRNQVTSELRTRSYVALAVLLAAFFYFAGNACFGDMGLLRYMELKQKKAAIEREVTAIMAGNDKLRADIEAYRNDNFYTEKNARENFGLAGKDEYIFMYKKGHN